MSAAGPRWSWLPLAAPFVVAVVALAAWQSLVMLYRIPAYLVPSPVLVARTLYADRVLLFSALSVTLGVALTALALATLVGVTTALLFVQSRWIEMSLFPYASCCR
jgi:ABC-type nitrate/sulfonate/bicarbonate transport system, permease component